MATPKHNANGHRRRELVKRVMAEETHCALCDTPVDKTLKYTPGAHGKKCPGSPNGKTPHGACTGCIPDPMRPEVDEDIPRSRGGSPYDRSNCHLLHRRCNQYKGALTLTEARTKLHTEAKDTPAPVLRPAIAASAIW